MPAWSPEVANEFILLAAANKRSLDQLQLQALVYIAHGWCLAFHREPLTGDRPEAWEFGPTYRRLADALAIYGLAPVTREIRESEVFPQSVCDPCKPVRSNLDRIELDSVRDVYQNYGAFGASQLSILTSGEDTPWATVYGDGVGKFRDIPHELVRAQFVELLRQSEEWHESS